MKVCRCTFNPVRSISTDRGMPLVIACTGTATCPVAMMKWYIGMAGLSIESSEKLFRGIVHTKEGDKLRKSGGLSYTQMRDGKDDAIGEGPCPIWHA